MILGLGAYTDLVLINNQLYYVNVMINAVST